VINFDTAESEIQFSDVENLPIDSTSTSVTLTPASMPTIEGTKFFLLEIIYLQEVNGTQYLLNNGGFNALSIIDVETPVV